MSFVLDMAMNYIDVLETVADSKAALDDILGQFDELKYPTGDDLELEVYVKGRLGLMKDVNITNKELLL